MPITVPSAGQEVSASTFGAPVALAINDLQTRMGGLWRRASNQSVPANTATLMSMDTEDADTNAFAAPPFTAITIPAGCGGVYGITFLAYVGIESGAVSIQLSTFVNPHSARANPVNAWACVSLVEALNPGDKISLYVWQNSAGAVNATGRLALWRIGP